MANYPLQTSRNLYFLAGLGYHFYFPAIQRETKLSSTKPFIVPAGWLPPTANDALALIPFAPETRLLFWDAFNVFACHESHLPELLSKFKPWP